MTLTEYLEQESVKMNRIMVNCIRYYGTHKEDGTLRRIWPDDFWEGWIFEDDFWEDDK